MNMNFINILAIIVIAFIMFFASPEIVSAEEDKGTYLITVESGYPFIPTCLPSISPDWEKIAYSTLYDLESGGRKLTLLVVNIDGTDMNKLDVSLIKENQGFHMIFGWDPNSEKILYAETSLSPTFTGGGLWIINSDGTDRKQLELELQMSLTPNIIWSPDGQKILFTEEFSTTKFSDNASYTDTTRKFYAVNTNDNSSTLIAEGTPLLWCTDTNEVVYYKKEFTGRGDVQYTTWKINPDRAIPIKLGNFNMTTDRLYNSGVSPDGSKITYEDHGIWVANVDGSSLTQLTSSDEDGSPVWSPDSKRIAFITSEEGIRKGIWVMNLDGSDQKRLLSFIPTYYWGLMGGVWSEDSTRVAYANFDLMNLTNDIYALDAGEPLTGEELLEEVEATSTFEGPAEEDKGTPGFKAISAIVGLLAVVYLFRRK